MQVGREKRPTGNFGQQGHASKTSYEVLHRALSRLCLGVPICKRRRLSWMIMKGWQLKNSVSQCNLSSSMSAHCEDTDQMKRHMAQGQENYHLSNSNL